MNKVVIALSGGLDSSTLLGSLLDNNMEVFCLIFKYPSKHNQYEIKSAIKIVEHYKNKGQEVSYNVVDVSSVFNLFKSDLLQSGDAIPEGHYESESMKKTVVPGRNAIFTTIMAGFAESVGASAVYLGIHSGDHAIYPDCRPLFISEIYNAIKASSDNKVSVIAPFIDYTKSDIIAIGTKLEVPFELTRTCYKDQENACGVCGSCNERLEAFKLLGIKDPINYE